MPGTLEDTRTVHCDEGFLPNMPTVTGARALAQRLKVRLTTRRGTVPWWPQFGTDLRGFLLSKAPPHRIVEATIAECEKDEQVRRVDCTAEILEDGRAVRLRLTIWLWEAGRVFRSTLTVTEARVTFGEDA